MIGATMTATNTERIEQLEAAIAELLTASKPVEVRNQYPFFARQETSYHNIRGVVDFTVLGKTRKGEYIVFSPDTGITTRAGGQLEVLY